MTILLFSCTFFIGFLIESIIGFGGTLIAYSVLLFFVDIKSLIISTIILPIIASLVIVFSDHKSISFKVLLLYAPICLIGVPFGIFLFDYLPSSIVLKVLAIFLILFGIKNIFFGIVTLKSWKGKFMVFLGGIIHGLVGSGGPVMIIGIKDAFKNKAELRVSMAIFFIILNIFRILQLIIFNNLNISDFFVNVWVAIPMIIGIFAGHKIHKKISEKQFSIILSIFFIVSGLILFCK